MSKLEHTAGPWTFKKQNPKDFSGMGSWGSVYEVTSVRGREAAEEYIGFTLDKANARLVAAAPEMLTVLKGCRDMLRESAKQHRLSGNAAHATMCQLQANEAIAVIAKAEGAE